MSMLLVITLLSVSLTAAEKRHPRPLSPVNHGADSGSHLDQGSPVDNRVDAKYSGTHKNVHEPPLNLVAKLNQDMLEQLKALKMDYSNKLDIYNHRMETMVQRLVESDVRMDKMARRLVESDSKVETLTQRSVESDVEMETMRQHLNNIIKENNELKPYLQGLWNPVDEHRTNKNSNMEDETRINTNTTIHAYSEVKFTGVVAFQARIAGFTGSPSEDITIPFDIVDLNIGNAYDAITGEFTPPVDGIYDISYGALANNSCGTDHVCVLLQVNGEHKSSSCSEYAASGSTSMSLQLTAGDTVAVVMATTPCVSLINTDVYNTFSGHLIYQII